MRKSISVLKLFYICVLFAVIAGILCLKLGFILGYWVDTPQSSLGDYRCVADCAYYVFQDGTKYGEYQYSQVTLEDNPYFKPVTQSNMEEVRMFVEDYEEWVDALKDNSEPEAIELYRSYSYDPASLSEDDYYYVEVKYLNRPLSNYTVFIFDSETLTLYSLKSWI